MKDAIRELRLRIIGQHMSKWPQVITTMSVEQLVELSEELHKLQELLPTLDRDIMYARGVMFETRKGAAK